MKLCNCNYITAPQPKLDSLTRSLRARLARYNILCKGSSIYSTPPSKAYNDCDNTVLMLRLTFIGKSKLLLIFRNICRKYEISLVRNILFLSPLVLSNWENLALLSLYTFCGKCVYFSIFERWNSQLCQTEHNCKFYHSKIQK